MNAQQRLCCPMTLSLVTVISPKHVRTPLDPSIVPKLSHVHLATLALAMAIVLVSS